MYNEKWLLFLMRMWLSIRVKYLKLWFYLLDFQKLEKHNFQNVNGLNNDCCNALWCKFTTEDSIIFLIPLSCIVVPTSTSTKEWLWLCNVRKWRTRTNDRRFVLSWGSLNPASASGGCTFFGAISSMVRFLETNLMTLTSAGLSVHVSVPWPILRPICVENGRMTTRFDAHITCIHRRSETENWIFLGPRRDKTPKRDAL